MERLVDTPVRGFVYEAAGPVPDSDLASGAGIVNRASQTWRIPVEIVDAKHSDYPAWRNAMLAASARLIRS